MSELLHLLSYVRPYWHRLGVAVILMAIVGACHGLVALLIGPVFDRVLNPASAEAPVVLYEVPFSGLGNPLERPGSVVGFECLDYGCDRILAVFIVKGLCDFSAII